MRPNARKTGVVTDVAPEGGYQDPKAFAGMHFTQSIIRCPVRCMYPDDFTAILRKHRHPRWPSIGVSASDRTNRERERETLFDPCGTIYVANVYEKRTLFAIPCNCIPYSSIRTATWNEERTKWENGEIVRGWRGALAAMVKTTYLAPSPELSWWIGEDTFKLFPIEARP